MNNSVKKTVKTLSQTALAVTLLMGNITPPAEQGFYEDDAGFNQVSTNMESGWGWGFNQAQAGENDNSCFRDTTDGEIIYCRDDSSSSQDSSYANNDIENAPQAVINLTETSLLVSTPSYSIDSATATTLEFASIEAAKQNSLLQGLTFSTNNLLAGRSA